MNERERMICARVSEFRKKVGWSQRDFAAQLGLSLNQLASIEYARTPLRYDVAWKLRTLFNVALEWLSVGELGPNSLFADNLPSPESTGLPESALLSDVSDKVNGSVPSFNFSAKEPKKIHLDKQDQKHRAFIAFNLRKLVDLWIAKVPTGYTSDFEDKFLELAKRYLSALPKEPDHIIEARLDALMWDEMRRDLKNRLPRGKGFSKHGVQVLLDKSSTDKDIDGVKAKIRSLQDLIEVLRKKLDARGEKSALARELNVSRQAVDQWLSGDAKPSAELTFKLLNWVERPERQKK